MANGQPPIMLAPLPNSGTTPLTASPGVQMPPLAPEIPLPPEVLNVRPGAEILRFPDGAQMEPSPGLPVTVLAEMFRRWQDNKVDELDEARIARRYYHCKQWTPEEKRILRSRNQPIVTSNRIKPKINYLVGIDDKVRRDPKAYPRGPEDEDAADVATKAIRYVTDNNNWQDISREGLRDGLINNHGAAFIGVERKGNRMEVRVKIAPPDRYFYDPRSDECDFSDRRYDGIHDWLDLGEAKEMWPDKSRELDLLVETAAGSGQVGMADGTAFELDKDLMWADFEKRRLRIVEMYYVHGGVWRYAIFCGPVILREGISPYLGEHGEPVSPYEPWTSYIDEEGIHYGVIRDMISPQDETNKRRSKLLHEASTVAMQARKGVVDDVDEAKRQVARADGWLEHEGTWGEDIGPINRTVDIQWQGQLLNEAKGEIENVGPNPTLTARSTVDRQSGRAIHAEANLGMTELAPVMAEHRAWKLRCYRAIWFRIRQFWREPRWIRVLDEEGKRKFVAINQPQIPVMGPEGPTAISLQEAQATGAQPIGPPQMVNPIPRIDVDILLDEGPDTITAQEDEFRILAELRMGGVEDITGEDLIEASNLRNKERILRRKREAQQDPAAMQAQLEAMRLQLEQAQADLEKTVAETGKTIAQTEESFSKSELNRANALSEIQQAESEDIKQEAGLLTET